MIGGLYGLSRCPGLVKCRQLCNAVCYKQLRQAVAEDVQNLMTVCILQVDKVDNVKTAVIAEPEDL